MWFEGSSLREELGLEADEADLEAYASISRADNHIATFPDGDRTHYFGLWFDLRRWRGEPAPDGEEMVDAGGSTRRRRPNRGSDRPGSDWNSTEPGRRVAGSRLVDASRAEPTLVGRGSMADVRSDPQDQVAEDAR
jgi:hypothetical protein